MRAAIGHSRPKCRRSRARIQKAKCRNFGRSVRPGNSLIDLATARADCYRQYTGVSRNWATKKRTTRKRTTRSFVLSVLPRTLRHAKPVLLFSTVERTLLPPRRAWSTEGAFTVRTRGGCCGWCAYTHGKFPHRIVDFRTFCRVLLVAKETAFGRCHRRE